VTVLAGDIGGTKTLLALMDTEVGHRTLAEQRYDSQAFDDFTQMLRLFVADTTGLPRPEAACFAIAGPVEGKRAKTTNLRWELDVDALANVLGTPRVRLINDFQAVGYGIEGLSGADVALLQVGDPRPQAPRAVLGAGTGLGQGILVWQYDHYEPLPTEGGHVDFAPTDDLQIELLRHLRHRFGRVSFERVLSGPGLHNIYQFLQERHSEQASPELRAAIEAGDPAAAISRAAVAGTDPLAVQALEMFVAIYGAQAGNLALTCLACGGLYVAGGIAPKLLDQLRSGPFMSQFLAKGRMSTLLAKVPVQVILNPKVGLLGAALAAGRIPPPAGDVGC
jgi:glucokinase